MTLLKALKRFFRPLWFRIVLGLAFVCVLLVVGTYWLLNWKGRQMLLHAEQQIAKEGETLDFKSLLPDPPADSENLGGLPIFKNITLPGEEGDAVRERLAPLTVPAPAEGTFDKRPPTNLWAQQSKPVDLSSHADWLRREGSLTMPADSGNAASDIFTALSAQDPLVQEIMSGVDRPLAIWVPSLKTRQLPDLMFALEVPHYKHIQAMSNYLALRSVSALQAGHARAAHDAILLQLRLAQATEKEGLVIGALVAVTQTSIVAQPMWEICRARVGTAADFQRLRRELDRLSPRTALLQAFRGELATSVSSICWIRDDPQKRALGEVAAGESREWWKDALVKVAPTGAYDANTAMVAMIYLDHFIKPLRDEGFTTMEMHQEEVNALMTKSKSSLLLYPELFASRVIFPIMEKIVQRTAYVEGVVQMMRAACSLEAFYLVHGRYPVTLAELTDEHGRPVPAAVDPMTNGDVRYQRTDDGRYRLWMTGADKEDDGGNRVLDSKNPEMTKLPGPGYEGDWVWGYLEVKESKFGQREPAKASTEQSKD
jgi:hypothetical protein